MKATWCRDNEYADLYESAEWQKFPALSADLAQMPDKPISRVGTGKEQWIGNPQDAELGRLQSAENADKLSGPRVIVYGLASWLMALCAWACVRFARFFN